MQDKKPLSETQNELNWSLIIKYTDHSDNELHFSWEQQACGLSFFRTPQKLETRTTSLSKNYFRVKSLKSTEYWEHESVDCLGKEERSECMGKGKIPFHYPWITTTKIFN